jgi:hypothetical protein
LTEIILGDHERSLLTRVVSAIERFVEAYETSIVNQTKVTEQTIETMKMAREMVDEE